MQHKKINYSKWDLRLCLSCVLNANPYNVLARNSRLIPSSRFSSFAVWFETGMVWNGMCWYNERSLTPKKNVEIKKKLLLVALKSLTERVLIMCEAVWGLSLVLEATIKDFYSKNWHLYLEGEEVGWMLFYSWSTIKWKCLCKRNMKSVCSVNGGNSQKRYET